MKRKTVKKKIKVKSPKPKSKIAKLVVKVKDKITKTEKVAKMITIRPSSTVTIEVTPEVYEEYRRQHNWPKGAENK